MTNVLPPPPVNSTGQPGQAAYLKATNSNAKLAALTGGTTVPTVSGATGSIETTKMLYKVAGQQHANRQFDGGRRKSRKSRKTKKSKKRRKKSRR
jgi:hypothetical protein